MSEKIYSLVIPFYNEEQNVVPVIEDLEKNFSAHGIARYEIIAVNNGSWDQTGALLKNLAQRNSRIKVVTIPRNQGLGYGVLEGFRAASGEFIGFNGGDGQSRGEDVVRVFQKLEKNHLDLCKVKRVVRQDGLQRRIISFFFNWLCRFLFRIKTRDVNGLPKVLTREALTRLELVSRDWFIDAEMILKAERLGLRMGEIEIEFQRREGGISHVNYGTVMEFLKNMLRYKCQGIPGNSGAFNARKG